MHFEIKKVCVLIKRRQECHFLGEYEQDSLLEVYTTHYLEFTFTNLR